MSRTTKSRMATFAGSDLHCGPCQFDNVNRYARKWCTDCEEGFCDECLRSHKAAKISRNHHAIPAEDYEKTKRLKVNLQCPDHNQRLEFYCPTHDSIVCVLCVQFKHAPCKDIRPLGDAVKDAKTSDAYFDLEQTIDGFLENIEKGVQHLQLNETTLREQEENAQKSIAKKRAEINMHLDRLEEKLLKALKSESEKALKEIYFSRENFETKRKIISDLKDTAQNMKQFSSNLQSFVGIRSILKTVVDEINRTKLLLSSIPQLSVAIKTDPKFDTFIETFDILGEIQITSKEVMVPYVERRLIQAQYHRPAEPPVLQLENLHLKLRTNIEMGETNSSVTNCLILPNKSIMIVSSNKPYLTILKEDGSHDRDISVPYDPCYVTIIDDQRVAVSYFDTCISIININTPNTNQTLKNLCKTWIAGITYNDGKLYAVVGMDGIKVIDLDGNIIKTIRIYKDAISTYKVTAQKDKIYYSVENGSVHCVDMEGTKIWTYQDDRLSGIPPIAVDNYGVTFASGVLNNLLLAIFPDSKQQKILLTSSDGLQNPNALYYDKDSKRLLVCNEKNGHAALYDVMY